MDKQWVDNRIVHLKYFVWILKTLKYFDCCFKIFYVNFKDFKIFWEDFKIFLEDFKI